MTPVSRRTKKIILVAVPTLIILALSTYGILSLRDKNTAVADTMVSTTDEFAVADAKKAQDIQRDFEFSIKNTEAEEVGKMKYTIEKVEIRDEIIVKGQKATSIPGRTFLVLTIKITNNLDYRLQINTRDYVRLAINDTEERLEFTIHNDPVEIGAISTRPTRLAIPIDDANQKLTLYVGEITGEKQAVDISLN